VSDLKKQAMWLFGGTCFAAALQIIQLGFLSRHLEARDLGVLALINSVLLIATVLQDMGMSSYLIHRQQLTSREQSTIFWINLAFGGLTGFLMLILSWPLAIFFKLPELKGLLILASLNFFILGMMTQYQSHFVKVKRVVLLAKVEMFSKFIAFIFVVMALLYTPLRASSVVIGLFINAALRVVIMMYLAERSWHPTREFCKNTAFKAMHYGKYQLGSQTINQLRTQADSLLIGKFLGAELLGIYSLAKELVLQPLKLITPVINRLTLPRFAERQHSGEDVKKIFLKATWWISVFSTLMFLTINILSPVVVRVIYGPGKEQVAMLIPMILLFGMLRPMGGLTGSISQANGKTNVEFWWNIWASVIMLTIIACALYWNSLVAVAIGLSLSQFVISLIVHPLFIKPVVGVTFLKYLRSWGIVTLMAIIIIFLVQSLNLYVYPESIGI